MLSWEEGVKVRVARVQNLRHIFIIFLFFAIFFFNGHIHS